MQLCGSLPVRLLEGLTVYRFLKRSFDILLSLLGMIALRRIKALSCISVSVCGGVLHNVGQTLMAWLLLDTAAVTYYLPFLVLSGTVSGVAIGIAAGIMIGRVDLDKVH